MCTNNENQIKIVLGKRIYEFLKLEYLECVRKYIKTHNAGNLGEIKPVVSIPANTRIKNVMIDGHVIQIARKYLAMDGVQFKSMYGNDGIIYFELSSLINEQQNKKSL